MLKMIGVALSVLLTLLTLLAGGPATAASGDWARTDEVSARLVSAVTGTGDLTTVPLGIEVKLKGDWKTYWRSPGDAGLPPTLDWQGSMNLAGATLLYPSPQRITVLGIQTFGYKHEVVFPVDAKLVHKGQPLDARLSLGLLVCAEQCIPKTLSLTLAIPTGPATPDADMQMLDEARAKVPGDARVSGIRILGAEEIADHGGQTLEVRAASDSAFQNPDIIAEVTPETELAPPRISLTDGGRQATFDLALKRKLPVGAHLAGRAVTFTLTDGRRATEQGTTIGAAASAANEAPGPSLLAMLGVALLGGLILNLMPCVLPVLNLKFFSVVSQGGRARGAVRAGFLATAAGIILSFLAIAAVLAALKAAGHSIGWGIQFQQPAFIVAMAVLVTIFACHLAGVFEVPLPRFIANAAAGRGGPEEGLAGHFVTGAFATLLATPCSAPFLGTAIGFALAGSAAVMMGIFLALGVGLALPYLLIAAVPQIATRMPKPGRWMLWVKQALAIPLVLTAGWLLYILDAQTGTAAALLTAGLLLAIVGLLLLRERLPETRRGVVFPGVIAVAVLAVMLPGLLPARGFAGGPEAHDTIAWRAFDRDQIRSLVSQGKTVFVDVTADWCLTCQANKRLVLSRGEIAQRLSGGVVAMQADWTRPSAPITAYLASYGRYGIPFNIVYGPGAPGGIVLPELLTPEAVGAALTSASNPPAG